MKKLSIIFLYFLVVRILFIIITGYDNCELCSDSDFIDRLSERALRGDFNFDIGRFIVAPFYNVFIAGHKWIFGGYWDWALVTSQLLLSALAGVYFYKLARLLFNETTARIGTFLFGIFPMTLYWVHTFCSEMVFQSVLIISIFFLVKSIKTERYLPLLLSAVLFVITFLTKSHIGLFSPFIALYLFINLSKSKRIQFPILFAAICLVATLPFGLYNLQKHDQYVLSSNGAKFHFYTGNSEFGYRSIVDVPPRNSVEFKALKNFDLAHFNGPIHDSLMALPHKVKQSAYFELAMNWIRANPKKFAELKAYNTAFFFLPGVSFRHYPLSGWLFSFLISFSHLHFGILGYPAFCQERFQAA